VYDYQLTPEERIIFYRLIINSGADIISTRREYIQDLFSRTLRKTYRPRDYFTFGTVIDGIVPVTTVDIIRFYESLQDIMASIRIGNILPDLGVYLHINSEIIDKANSDLFILKKSTAASPEQHPNTASSSAAAPRVPTTTASSSAAASHVSTANIEGCGPGGCAISGGAKKNRRRGTKRARRTRRRSSRKN
jgi:hypothetical protein